MHQYLAEIYLPDEFSPAFMALIPAQRAKINHLLKEGTIRSYSLDMGRSKVWVVLVIESEEAAEELLEDFPVMPYCDYRIFELMFHDMASNELPRISLN
jgi:muconolactone delta-isomerase